MTATAPTLEARINRQNQLCALCENDDGRELIRCFDPGDPDAGVFKACIECADECGLESYEQGN